MSQDNSSADSELSFAEMFAAQTGVSETLSDGSLVEASVISMGRDFIFLDLGQGREGRVARTALDDDGAVEMADRIQVFVTGRVEGVYTCAQRAGSRDESSQSNDKEIALAQLDEARVAQMPVEGVVKETNKGGFVVQVMGFRAFCPISQIDDSFCEDPAEHVGHSYDFMVTQIKGARDVVVSRRRVLERDKAQQAELLWQKLEVSQVLEGKVASVQKYGAFVELGGVQGLIHVSELAHERIADPASVIEAGQAVRVAVVSIDRERQRIGLSLKALMDDPWMEAPIRFKPDTVISGEVIRIAPFGAFVELTKGVDGLLHISQLGGGRRINNPREVVREGQRVEVRVLDIDLEQKRISLTLASHDSDDADTGGLASVELPAQQGGFGTFGDLFARSTKNK